VAYLKERYLISQGVSGARLGTKGLGETEPVASDETEAGRVEQLREELS